MASELSNTTASTTQGVFIHPSCTREHYWDYTRLAAVKKAKECRGCKREDNSLLLNFPELASEFLEEVNGVSVNEVTTGSHAKYWWECRLAGHKFQKTVSERLISYGTSCKDCKAVEELEGNELSTIAPDIAKYYDETKNPLKASEISVKDTAIVHWFCDNGHSYTCAVYNKVRKGTGCNECARSRNRATVANNLAVLHPELAKEFDVTVNGVTADSVLPGNGTVYSWTCPEGHSWLATPNERTFFARSCPDCKVGERGLASLYPEIAAQFDATKNGEMPARLLSGSMSVYWWKCEAFGHEWKSSVYGRTSKNENKGAGCPQCLHLIPSPEYNAAVLYPYFKDRYSTVKNKKSLESYMPKSTVKVWWECENGHAKLSSIANEGKAGYYYCPDCPQALPYELGKTLGDLYPEVAKEFNTAKNGITPFEIMARSSKKMFWECRDGHIWEAVVSSRTKDGKGCPVCAGKIATPTNNLSYFYPNVAKYFDEGKNGFPATSVLPNSQKKVWWKCSKGHSTLAMPLNKTRQGDGCPECSTSGTSKIEQLFKEEFIKGGVINNVFIPTKHRIQVLVNGKMKSMAVDIVGEFDGKPIAIEYDGYYYHSGVRLGSKVKAFAHDAKKTQELLDAGYIVVRIRETTSNGVLDELDMQHPNLIQIKHRYKVNQKSLRIQAVADTISSVHELLLRRK